MGGAFTASVVSVARQIIFSAVTTYSVSKKGSKACQLHALLLLVRAKKRRDPLALPRLGAAWGYLGIPANPLVRQISSSHRLPL
jgi:hypothetical protein